MVGRIIARRLPEAIPLATIVLVCLNHLPAPVAAIGYFVCVGRLYTIGLQIGDRVREAKQVKSCSETSAGITADANKQIECKAQDGREK